MPLKPDILDDPSAGMYSCEVTTTSFRSMVASGEMRVIGGLRVALKKIVIIWEFVPTWGGGESSR